MVEEYDVAIIGAGVAGLTAALYASRQKLKTVVISQDLGGQLNLTPNLQNFPGFSLTSGELLARTLEYQVSNYGGIVLFDYVQSIEETEDHSFTINTQNRKVTCKAVVLAIGKIPRELGLANEKSLVNKGIHYATRSTAPFY